MASGHLEFFESGCLRSMHGTPINIPLETGLALWLLLIAQGGVGAIVEAVVDYGADVTARRGQ